MLKWYADVTELDEAAVTPSAMRRIYFLLALSIPFFPLITLEYFLPSQGGIIWKSLFWIALLLSAGASVCLFLTRIINRVWVRDEHLDEWEKAVKHKSMSVGYMFLTYTFSIFFGLVFVCHEMMDGNLPNNSSEILGFVVIGAVIFSIYVQIIQQLVMMRPMDEDEVKKPEFIKTRSRDILGIMALVGVLFFTIIFSAGYYSGHREHNLVHTASEAACGEADVDTHKTSKKTIEVTCEGSDRVIYLDLKTLKPIQP